MDAGEKRLAGGHGDELAKSFRTNGRYIPAYVIDRLLPVGATDRVIDLVTGDRSLTVVNVSAGRERSAAGRSIDGQWAGRGIGVKTICHVKTCVGVCGRTG